MKTFTQTLFAMLILGLNLNLSSQDALKAYEIKNPVFWRNFNEQPLLAQKTTSAHLIEDTLWYFFNKCIYRNPSFTVVGVKTVPSLAGTGYFGSIFLNPGTVDVKGLEGVFVRPPSSSQNLPVKLYLCDLSAGHIPVLPPVDSVNVTISGTLPNIAGANFTSPHTFTSDFAVLCKNASLVPNDTLFTVLNNALTPTSTSTNSNAKYGEGLGIYRTATGFHPTTNAFGSGSDYEPLLAPRVAYSVNVSVTAPSSSLCMDQSYTFTNNASAFLTHRQYNLNQFYKVWQPFGLSQATAFIDPDSVFTIDFDNGQGPQVMAGSTITQTYIFSGTFNDTLIAHLRKMSAYLVGGQQLAIPDKISLKEVFSEKVADCSNITGITAVKEKTGISVYPNPSLSGWTTLSGLSGHATITLYDCTGRMIFTKETDTETFTIDLSSEKNAIYLIRICDSGSNTRILKVVNQME